MKRWSSIGRAAGVLGTAAILAGCGNAQPALAPAGATLGDGARSAQSASVFADARERELLYVTDGVADAVDMYHLPSGKLFGSLTGLEGAPGGACSDGPRVAITMPDESNVLLYNAGATRPLKALSDAGAYPASCSIDKTTRNVAVSNIISTSDGEGSVAVYAHSAGIPTAFTCAVLSRYYFLGYDNKGNLFVDGENSDGAFGFCELPHGSTSMKSISLNQSIGFPGQVQYDGTYVTVEDQDSDTIYRFAISGSSGTEKGSVVLGGVSDAAGSWIENGKVYSGSAGSEAGVHVWAYPAGGEPIATVETGLVGAVTVANYRP